MAAITLLTYRGRAGKRAHGVRGRRSLRSPFLSETREVSKAGYYYQRFQHPPRSSRSRYTTISQGKEPSTHVGLVFILNRNGHQAVMQGATPLHGISQNRSSGACAAN